MARDYKWLPLSKVHKWEDEAAKRGVSKVARSDRGFLAALETYGRRKLPEKWKRKRSNFIKRHMAQVKQNGEALMKDGKPTRRHLALIMWAYSPRPKSI